MTVNITLSCDGCFKETGPYQLPHRQFQSFNGKGHGFGIWNTPSIEDIRFPEGWIYSDPYTGCTYCPECWNDIIKDTA